MKSNVIRTVHFWTACLLLAGAAPAHAYTAKYFAWTTPSTECADEGGEDLPRSAEEAAAWFNKLRDKGYSSAGYLVDGLDTDRFCDPDHSPFSEAECSDASNGVDEGTAILIYVHGLADPDWIGLLNDRGAADETCFANVGDSFKVGDGKAAFVHLNSCESLDDHSLIDAPEMMYDSVDSEDSGNYLHLLTGFHGNSWGGVKHALKRLAKSGYDSSVADAWMDHLYASIKCGWGTGCYEQCPVVVASGASDTEANDHLDDDTYSDPNADPTGHGAMAYVAFEGCDPKDEPPFDPDDEYDSSDW